MGLLDWLLPPKWRSLLQNLKAYGYSGNYSSWSAATAASVGYADAQLFDKVKKAALSVHAGEAAFDRDSVLFKEYEYDYPVLAALMFVAQKQEHLAVLDFGGATGSMYYQYRKILSQTTNIKWSVVEQPHFVHFGQTALQDDRLRFYLSLEAAQSERASDLAILGCVLPYLEQPDLWLAKLYASGFPYVLIDKHPLIPGDVDRLTVQKTNPKVYRASYPAWFFGEAKFRAALKGRYEIIFEYVCPDQSNLPQSSFKGFFLKRLS